MVSVLEPAGSLSRSVMHGFVGVDRRLSCGGDPVASPGGDSCSWTRGRQSGAVLGRRSVAALQGSALFRGASFTAGRGLPAFTRPS